MSEGRVTGVGQQANRDPAGQRAGNGQLDGRRRRRRGRDRGEQLTVPHAEFRSYYGRPVIKESLWREPEVPGYLFLGGLAGASSVLAAVAQASGHRELARNAKIAAMGAGQLSAIALIADLGRPARWYNMLRAFKTSSPMSVGSWLLAGYGPLAGSAAISAVTGWLPRAGATATAGAAVLGPGIATYTAALLCDTAVPAWHEAHREMPYLFAGSAASAAGGLAMLTAPSGQEAQAVTFAVLGAATELTAKQLLVRRLGKIARPYQEGRPGKLMRVAEGLTAAALTCSVLGWRSRPASGPVIRAAGLALVAASAVTRFGIFEAGQASARDPGYTVGPQRERLQERAAADV